MRQAVSTTWAVDARPSAEFPWSALIGAITLHLGALALVAGWSGPAPLKPPGQNELAIDLAPAAVPLAPSEAPPPEPLAAIDPETVEATAPAAPEPARAPDPAPVAPAEELATALLPDDVILVRPVDELPPPLPVVTPEANPEIRPEPQPKPRAKPDPKPVDRERVRERPRPSSAQTAPAVEAARRDEAAGRGAAASASDQSAYAARLVAAIRRALRHPGGARTGTVLVRMTLGPGGEVMAASLARSAGDPALDGAAMDAIRSASLPAPPAGFPARVTVTAPVQFTLAR